MKTITKTIAAIVLTLTIFCFPALADCGEQNNGNRCLVQTTQPAVTKTAEKQTFDFEKEISTFFKNIFRGIFG